MGFLNITTINANDLAINPLAGIGSQKTHQRRHILRLTEAIKRAGLHHRLHLLLRLPREEHVSGYRTWSHTVGGDPTAFELLG